MINRRDVLNSTQSEEKIELSKIYDKYLRAYKNYEISFTEFINPVLLAKAYSVFKYDKDIDLKIDGGFEVSERNIIIFSNVNINDENYNSPLSFCKITYNTKYSGKLQHKDFLGSLIGLGIKREKIGDIHLFEECVVVIMYKDIVSYVINNLEYVGRTKVKVEEVTLEDCKDLFSNDSKKELTITVSSLRLDVVIAKVFNLSRSNVLKFINSDKVFINWLMCNNSSKELKDGDIITARGYGRIKILNIKGMSKKGKVILNIIMY